MSNTVDNAFVRQYERDAHMVFQRKGSKLRPTVRLKDGIVGKSTTFQKIGTGTATTKARHGAITPMNQDHTAIECTLYDFYAGDWVDKLDEAKVNIDERMAIAKGGAYALGRKVDEQILTELDATTQTTISWTVSSSAAVRNGLIEMVEALFGNDVDDDGENFGLLTPRAWAMAMTVEEFASSDYVSTAAFEGGPPVGRFKEWLGLKWQMHTGLPGVGTASAKVFAYNKSAIGYATGAHAGNAAQNNAVSADIQWYGHRAAHWVNHMMSGGGKLIDDAGVIEGTLDDTANIPTS